MSFMHQLWMGSHSGRKDVGLTMLAWDEIHFRSCKYRIDILFKFPMSQKHFWYNYKFLFFVLNDVNLWTICQNKYAI